MKKFICPNCRDNMSLNSTDGTLTCISCGKSIPVTDFEHHEFGSIKNSQYIKKYADKNKDTHTDGFKIENSEAPGQSNNCSTEYYIPFELEADDVRSIIYKKPGKHFFTQAFKKVLKEQLFEKMYVPVWSNEVMVKSSINAACTEFDGNVTSYYDVEKDAQLLFEQFNTMATTMNGTLHVDSLFPYNFESAVCKDDSLDKNESGNEAVKALKADIPSDRYADNIKKYADRAASDKLNTLLSPYSSAHNKIYECDSNVLSSKLIYLPVWKIPFAEKESECLYVNGQTGKSAGKLPISRLKSAVSITLTFAVIFAAFISAAYFAGI